MRYLLDASVLTPLLLDLGETVLRLAVETPLYITDLAVYEAGNSLWKLASLLGTLSLEDAYEIASVLHALVARRVLRLVRCDDLEARRVLEIAVREKLTFYDASYIAAAEKLNAVLVTEDRELREKARKYVATTTYTGLRDSLPIHT